MAPAENRSSDALGQQLAYFREHQSWLAEQHHGKVVVIHGETVVGFFDSDAEAYAAAVKEHNPGSFLIRRCLRLEEETPQVFNSRLRAS